MLDVLLSNIINKNINEAINEWSCDCLLLRQKYGDFMLLEESVYGEAIISLIREHILDKLRKGYLWWEKNEYGEVEVDNIYYCLSQEQQEQILKLFRKHCFLLKDDLEYMNLKIEREDFFDDIVDCVMGIMDEEIEQESDDQDEYNDEFYLCEDSNTNQLIY